MDNFEDILAKATAAAGDGRPFVMYASPGSQSVTAIFQREYTGAIDFSTPRFMFCSFKGDRRFFIPGSKSDTLTSAISDSAAPPLTNPMPSFMPKEKNTFEALVRKGIAAISRGKMGKVVLSRKETVASHSDFATIYHRLLLLYPMAFRYCWFHPQTGLWMGASPERLLKTKDKSFNTVALAGTQRFIDTEHVLWREKETKEQQFVTDFIVAGLKDKATEIKLSEPYTARAGDLLHIKTDIDGVLADGSALENIIDILHPTPAVCGYPKAEAKKFIMAYEGYDREFYSGYLGEIGPSHSDLYVNLRCMKVDGNVAHLYIGCGITKDSVPEKEFDETVNKALTMKRVLS